MKKFLMIIPILLLIAFVSFGYYSRAKDVEIQEQLQAEIINESLGPIIQKTVVELEEKYETMDPEEAFHEDENVIADIKIYNNTNPVLYFCNLDFKNDDVPLNSDLFASVLELMSKDERPEVGVMFEVKLLGENLVSGTFSISDNERSDILFMWNQDYKNYETYYNENYK